MSDGSASDSATVTITVNGVAEPPPGAFTLAVNAYKVKGVKRADLTWAGAAGTNVDVYRNGAHVTITANDGVFSETLGKGGGSYTYQLCEAGTSTCSNSVTVSY